jgi:hypothetical protein
MTTATARAILAIANSFPRHETGGLTQGLVAGFVRLFRPAPGTRSVADAAGGGGGVIVGGGAGLSGCCGGGATEPESGVAVDG